jgi:hypothetical protein
MLVSVGSNRPSRVGRSRSASATIADRREAGVRVQHPTSLPYLATFEVGEPQTTGLKPGYTLRPCETTIATRSVVSLGSGRFVRGAVRPG